MPRKRTTDDQSAAKEQRAPKQPRSAEELSARDLYLREKERRAGARLAAADPLAEARKEYEAQLAANVVAGRGGRPKKAKGAPAKATADDELDDASDDE